MEDILRIRSNKILAVEGKDECNFFDELLKNININNIQLIDIGGIDKFKYHIPLLIKSDGFTKVEVIGFIRDAEKNQASSAFNSICNILRRNKLTPPSSIRNTSINKPKIGIFIMPNNQDSGMLEDLCLKSIELLPISGCIDKYIDCFKYDTDLDKYNESKSKVLSYLATNIPIVNSLGLAAKRKYWNFNNSCFDDVKTFLRQLF